MSEKIITELDKELQARIEQQEESVRKHEQEQGLIDTLNERFKALHASCGRILLGEQRKGLVKNTEGESTRARSKYMGNQFGPGESAGLYFGTHRRYSHDVTEPIKLSDPVFEATDRGLHAQIHRLRPFTQAITVGIPALPVVDPSRAAFAVEFTGMERGTTARKLVVMQYKSHWLKHEGSLNYYYDTDEVNDIVYRGSYATSIKPDEILIELIETNEILQPIVDGYGQPVAQTLEKQ